MRETGTVATDQYIEEELEKLDTQELLNLYKKTGDESLKWPLVMRYTGLIKSVATQIQGIYSGFAQVDDIVNEGLLTLLSSIDKFDPEKGVKFETYISKRIRGMVIDLARKQDWIPRNIRQRAKEIDQTVLELSSVLGRYPTDEEIVERLGITRDRYQKDIAGITLSNVLSLDTLLDMRDTDNYHIEVPSDDDQAQPERALEARELQLTLAKGISELSKNEQIVLSLYYEKNLRMKEIAQVMDVSSPRISQIHARAIQKLRDYMERYLRGEAETAVRKGSGKRDVQGIL